MTTGKCHGPNCQCSALIEAHIIPRAFSALVRGKDTRVANMQLTRHYAKQAFPQLGEYDAGILCAACDARLGKLDDYAIEISRRFQHEATKVGSFYVMQDVDGDRLAKFFASVIWRASISTRPSFSEIDLGPHSDAVRDTIFSEEPLTSDTGVQVALERFESAHIDVLKMYSVPRPSNLGGFNGYGFLIAGFRVFVKIDKRPLPEDQSNGLLGRQGTLQLFARQFEETSEFEATADMIIAQHRRNPRNRD